MNLPKNAKIFFQECGLFCKSLLFPEIQFRCIPLSRFRGGERYQKQYRQNRISVPQVKKVNAAAAVNVQKHLISGCNVWYNKK